MVVHSQPHGWLMGEQKLKPKLLELWGPSHLPSKELCLVKSYSHPHRDTDPRLHLWFWLATSGILGSKAKKDDLPSSWVCRRWAKWVLNLPWSFPNFCALNRPIYFVCFLYVPCLQPLCLPRGHSWEHHDCWTWSYFSEVCLGSGNKTHSYLGQKSGPGFSREGGMRAVLVAVPDVTTPLWLWPWSHPANSCLVSQKLKLHLSQVCHTPFLQHWTCGCWHSFFKIWELKPKCFQDHDR